MGPEAPESAATAGTDGIESSLGRVWVVADEDADCTHPTDRLRRVGDDGVNVYYRCERCEAVLVAQDELVRAAATADGRMRKPDAATDD